MPYGFLLGLPNCNQEPLASNFNPEILNGYINCLHPAAGAVYHYLWVISSEDALWDGFQTLPNNHNPFDKPGIQGQLFKENRASEITKEQTFNGILNFAMYKERSQWLFFEFVTQSKLHCRPIRIFFVFAQSWKQMAETISITWKPMPIEPL